MFLASIDVGIVNLAVVFAELHDVTFEITRFLQLENVNTTIMSHTTVTRQNCTLGHAKTTADRISHFVQERQTLFDACQERQPLVGLTDVEQVLFLLFRTKAQLVSPNAMHCFFNINGFNYQGRKQQTTMIVDHYLDPHVFPWKDATTSPTPFVYFFTGSLHNERQSPRQSLSPRPLPSKATTSWKSSKKT